MKGFKQQVKVGNLYQKAQWKHFNELNHFHYDQQLVPGHLQIPDWFSSGAFRWNSQVCGTMKITTGFYQTYFGNGNSWSHCMVPTTYYNEVFENGRQLSKNNPWKHEKKAWKAQARSDRLEQRAYRQYARGNDVKASNLLQRSEKQQQRAFNQQRKAWGANWNGYVTRFPWMFHGRRPGALICMSGPNCANICNLWFNHPGQFNQCYQFAF